MPDAILLRPRRASSEEVPGVHRGDPQGAAVGEDEMIISHQYVCESCTATVSMEYLGGAVFPTVPECPTCRRVMHTVWELISREIRLASQELP